MYGPNAIKMPKLFAYILEMGFDIRNADEFVTLPPDESHLLTALEEQELWYHGNVPPRRADDNDMRHVISHLEEMKGQRFAELEKRDPGIAAKARAHTADHMRKLALVQEQQEQMMMQMAQAAGAQGIGDQAGAAPGAPEGAATPDQQPGSPKIRANEPQDQSRHGENVQNTRSSAMREAPNAGAA